MRIITEQPKSILLDLNWKRRLAMFLLGKKYWIYHDGTVLYGKVPNISNSTLIPIGIVSGRWSIKFLFKGNRS